MPQPNESIEVPNERASLSSGPHNNFVSKGKKIGIFLALFTFSGFIAWNFMKDTKKPDDEKIERNVIKQTTRYEPPLAAPPIEPLSVLPTPIPMPEAATNLTDASRKAPLVVFKKQSQGNTPVSPNQNVVDQPLEAKSADDTKFDSMLKPTKLEGSKAGMLSHRDFVIAIGTSIPCILETAISSDQPGFASCMINRDILSDNGRVVLLEKGTQIVGEYRAGIKRGQSRLFVLWTRAKTPSGVIITLASPATDALGRTGAEGEINTHWWERFGSAMLLSMVDGASSYAASKLQGGSSGGGNNGGFQGVSGAGKDAASVALEQSINIPPTLQKNQGEFMNIFVVRDLDFSNVYKLRVTEPKKKIINRAIEGDFSASRGP